MSNKVQKMLGIALTGVIGSNSFVTLVASGHGAATNSLLTGFTGGMAAEANTSIDEEGMAAEANTSIDEGEMAAEANTSIYEGGIAVEVNASRNKIVKCDKKSHTNLPDSGVQDDDDDDDIEGLVNRLDNVSLDDKRKDACDVAVKNVREEKQKMEQRKSLLIEINSIIQRNLETCSRLKKKVNNHMMQIDEQTGNLPTVRTDEGERLLDEHINFWSKENYCVSDALSFFKQLLNIDKKIEISALNELKTKILEKQREVDELKLTIENYKPLEIYGIIFGGVNGEEDDEEIEECKDKTVEGENNNIYNEDELLAIQDKKTIRAYKRKIPACIRNIERDLYGQINSCIAKNIINFLSSEYDSLIVGIDEKVNREVNARLSQFGKVVKIDVVTNNIINELKNYIYIRRVIFEQIEVNEKILIGFSFCYSPEQTKRDYCNDIILNKVMLKCEENPNLLNLLTKRKEDFLRWAVNDADKLLTEMSALRNCINNQLFTIYGIIANIDSTIANDKSDDKSESFSESIKSIISKYEEIKQKSIEELTTNSNVRRMLAIKQELQTLEDSLRADRQVQNMLLESVGLKLKNADEELKILLTIVNEKQKSCLGDLCGKVSSLQGQVNTLISASQVDIKQINEIEQTFEKEIGCCIPAIKTSIINMLAQRDSVVGNIIKMIRAVDNKLESFNENDKKIILEYEANKQDSFQRLVPDTTINAKRIAEISQLLKKFDNFVINKQLQQKLLGSVNLKLNNAMEEIRILETMVGEKEKSSLTDLFGKVSALKERIGVLNIEQQDFNEEINILNQTFIWQINPALQGIKGLIVNVLQQKIENLNIIIEIMKANNVLQLFDKDMQYRVLVYTQNIEGSENKNGANISKELTTNITTERMLEISQYLQTFDTLETNGNVQQMLLNDLNLMLKNTIENMGKLETISDSGERKSWLIDWKRKVSGFQERVNVLNVTQVDFYKEFKVIKQTFEVEIGRYIEFVKNLIVDELKERIEILNNTIETIKASGALSLVDQNIQRGVLVYTENIEGLENQNGANISKELTTDISIERMLEISQYLRTLNVLTTDVQVRQMLLVRLNSMLNDAKEEVGTLETMVSEIDEQEKNDLINWQKKVDDLQKRVNVLNVTQPKFNEEISRLYKTFEQQINPALQGIKGSIADKLKRRIEDLNYLIDIIKATNNFSSIFNDGEKKIILEYEANKQALSQELTTNISAKSILAISQYLQTFNVLKKDIRVQRIILINNLNASVKNAKREIEWFISIGRDKGSLTDLNKRVSDLQERIRVLNVTQLDFDGKFSEIKKTFEEQIQPTTKSAKGLVVNELKERIENISFTLDEMLKCDSINDMAKREIGALCGRFVSDINRDSESLDKDDLSVETLQRITTSLYQKEYKLQVINNQLVLLNQLNLDLEMLKENISIIPDYIIMEITKDAAEISYLRGLSATVYNLQQQVMWLVSNLRESNIGLAKAEKDRHKIRQEFNTIIGKNIVQNMWVKGLELRLKTLSTGNLSDDSQYIIDLLKSEVMELTGNLLNSQIDVELIIDEIKQVNKKFNNLNNAGCSKTEM